MQLFSGNRMTAVGIVKEIDKNRAKIEVYGDKAGCSTCSAGKCSTCSAGKSRIYTAMNNRNLMLKEGLLVEVSLSSLKTLISFLRVIVIPLTLFSAIHYSTGKLGISEGYRLVSGFAGLTAGFAANYLIPAVIKEREMPEIVKVIQ